MVGDNRSFTFSHIGSGIHSYQWQKDGADLSDTGSISGSTTDTLTITGLALSDAGYYSVTVTSIDGYGSPDTSDTVALKVNAKPSVTGDVTGQLAYAGAPATFTVTATGTDPLYYQWQISIDDGNNWKKLLGGSSDSYTQNFVQPSEDTYKYKVEITNNYGSVESSTGELTVTDVTITNEPDSLTVDAGQEAIFTVGTISINGGETYQWQKDGEDLSDTGTISGATTDTLTILSLIHI